MGGGGGEFILKFMFIFVGENVLLTKLYFMNDKHFSPACRYLFKARRLLLGVACFLLTVSAHAQTGGSQEKMLKGTVKDAQGQPLPGVSVIIQGTKKGTQTDFDGNYVIKVKNSDTLVFSMVGRRTQVNPVEGLNLLDVILQMQAEEIDEMVIVGYGTQSRKKVATNQTTVKADAIQNRGVANVQQALQGLAPNLLITPIASDGAGGEPGVGMNIRLRGFASINSGGGGSPLILVDGMEQDINTLDPNDIATVTVLEDVASSSVYGARGSFGVILIETKKGGEPQVRYSGSVVAAQILDSFPIANSYDYALAHNEANKNDGANPWYNEARLKRIKEYLNKPAIADREDDRLGNNDGRISHRYEGNQNSNAFNEIFQSTSWRHQHNLGVSGTAKYGEKDSTTGLQYKKVAYNLSASLFDEGGQMNAFDDGYVRKNVGLNVQATPKKWLQVGVNTRYTRRDIYAPEYGQFGRYGRRVGLRFASKSIVPTMPLWVKNDDGTLTHVNESPIAYYKQAGLAKTDIDNLGSVISVVLTPLENWKTFVRYRVRQEWKKETAYITRARASSGFDGSTVVMQPSFSGRYSTNEYRNAYISPQIYSQYELNLGANYLKLMAGFEQEESKNHNVWAQRYGNISEDVQSIRTSTGIQNNDEGKSHWSTRSVFGALSYTFDKKYILNFSFRRDGSSRFIKDKRFGNFFSYALGYNLEQENILKPLLKAAKIDRFKLKFSMGQVGNQSIGLYQYIEKVPIRTNVYWISNGKRDVYAVAPSLINKDATWETVKDMNIGYELAALGNRLTSRFTWFNRTTSDMLGPIAPLPSTLGAGVPRGNSAELLTKGWEFTVKWNDKIGDIGYGVNFMLSDAQSEITKYYNPKKVLSDWYVGQKIGEIWGYETVGIMDKATAAKVKANSASGTTKGTSEFPNQNRFGAQWEAGDIRYKDLDGDGKITTGDNTAEVQYDKNGKAIAGTGPGDRKVIGNTTPRYSYVIDTNVSYKNFNLRLFFQGIGSRQVWVDAGMGGNRYWAIYSAHLDYWKDDNKNAFYPRPYFNSGRNRQTQSRYLSDASYLRLKTVTLSYVFEPNLLSKIKLKSANIFLSAENIFTYTNMRDYVDPELTNGFWGEVGDSYPLAKTYSVGLNLTF